MSNLILIGMPGSGKSTIGKRLSSLTTLSYVDTDDLIENKAGMTLQAIMDAKGWRELRKLEAEAILSLSLQNHIISTGGSAVYSEEAMRHLGKNGRIVFLDVRIEDIERRIGDFSKRGIAKPSEQSIASLCEERKNLYLKYSDTHIDCTSLSEQEVCDAIITKLKLCN